MTSRSQAILFPGQGAQKVGMAVDFMASYPAAKELFDRAADLLGYDLPGLCQNGPSEDLTATKHCQPAIFVTSAAIVTVLENEGILNRSEVKATAGLSLGEYTALWYAGAFSFEDGLRLVSKRGTFMQEASDHPPSGMVALVGAEPEQAERVANKAAESEVLTVANFLSPGQIVLSGTKTAVERAVVVAKEEGIRRAIVLNVAGAFHSSLMAPAAAKLRVELEATEIVAPRIPVAGNVTGQFMRDASEIRRCLEAQVLKPVLWVDAMTTVLGSGVSSFVEPGPGKVLTGLLKKIDRDAVCTSFNAVTDLENAAQA
ncbi:MAG: ACP S-malonyltransferase [Planctomycetota bacterium]